MVSPLKRLSIPWLELGAAQLLAKLLDITKGARMLYASVDKARQDAVGIIEIKIVDYYYEIYFI